MAWQWVKEDNGGDAILINGWEKGISAGPTTGLNKMLAVDLEVPGEVAVGYPITASTISGGTLGKPIARSTRFFPSYGTAVGNPTGAAQSYAILDNGGLVFEATTISGTFALLSSSNSTTGSSNKDGIAYWLGYLFKTRGANIDYWDGSTWHTGWQTTLSSGVQHYMYVATDNNLYITNGNSVARVFAPAPASFDPTSSGTFDFNLDILSLPVTDIALSLAEVGGGNSAQSTLLIGGAQNAIYPWDKISPSFSLPIYVADGYIKRMISVNQNAFIFPGNTGGRGRIYVTNGSQADLYFKIPDYIFGEQDPYYEWGDAIYHRNNLIFGFFVDHNDGTGVILSSEVWALNLSQTTLPTGISLPEKSFRSISSISTSTAKAQASVLIAAVNPSTKGFSYIVGWDDNGSSPGIGYSGTTAGVNATGATIDTDLMPIGTLMMKKTFSQIEFKLRSPLASGESISLYSITDNTNTVLLGTTTFAGSGAVISDVYVVNFENVQWLKLEVVMVGNSATSGVRLQELRIR